jgi:hypothetical protein
MQQVAIIDVGGHKLAISSPREAARRNFAYKLDSGGRRPITVFYEWRVRSGLEARNAGESRFVGAFGAFVAEHNGEELNFSIGGVENTQIVDDKTGTRWNILGKGMDGPRTGEFLSPVHVEQGFWFAMSAAYPGIELAEP